MISGKNPVVRRGRPLDPAKKAAIVEAAGCLFLEQGFRATSMDQIARAAGVSKLTLYHRFADKDALFAAVVQHKCQQYLPDDLFAGFDHAPPRAALTAFGQGFLRLLTGAESLGMYRMLLAETTHTPHLAGLFYQAGPMRVKTALLEKITLWQQQGMFGDISPVMARDFFIALFSGSDIHMQAMLHPGFFIDTVLIDAYVAQAVDFFLGRFAVNSG